MTLQTIFLDNSVQAWIVALAASFGSLVVLLMLRRIAVRRLRHFAEQTTTQWDDLLADVLQRTSVVLLLVLSLEIGASLLTLSARASWWLKTALTLTLLLQAGLWASSLLNGVLRRYRDEKLAEDRGAATMIGALGFMVQVLVWALVVLLALASLGVNITALVAGLGVGGIAIALALQKILGDLFSSLAILLDKPFVLGDFIIVGDLLGSVEHIGLKSTRVRALSGEQLIFSNADLLDSRIRNFGRMYERRVVFKIGVTYETPRALLQRIPEMLKTAVLANEQVRFDRAHFASYGDFSIDFETVYYVLSPDYTLFMDIQQVVNLSLHEQFEDAGIQFAYPTQTLHLMRAGAATQATALAGSEPQ